MSDLKSRLPEDWDFGPIESHIDFLTGPAFDSKRFTDDDNGVRLARGINITTGMMRWGKSITQYWPKLTSEVARYVLAQGDILIGMDGSKVGKNYAFLKEQDIPALLVQRVARLRTDKELAAKFLYYYIASDFWISHVESVKTASAIPHISNGDIKHFEIAKPPLPEQRKIARILTTLDNLIEKTQALIAKYQSIKQGMMHDLFTRGVDARGRLRPTHAQAPDLYKQSELGWVPKEWEVPKVNEIGSVQLGRQRSPKHQSGRYTTPYLRVANVFDGFFKLSDVLEMDFTPREREMYSVLPGDILLNEGQSLELVGRSATYEGEPNVYCFQNTLVRFRAFDGNDYRYCREVFKRWLDIGGFMMIASQTTSVAHLGASRFAKMRFPKPKPDEQVRIADRLTQFNKQVESEQLHLQKLKKTKSGLMQDLLTGKVRVKVDEAKEACANA